MIHPSDLEPNQVRTSMDHTDHIALIRDGIPEPGGIWADFGSGHGAFTLALAELIGAGGQIYSVDKDAASIKQQQRELSIRFPDVVVNYIHHNYTKQLNLPPLDGIIMANSIHFQRQKGPILQRIREYIKPGGRFILVEYNVDRGNPWVPYPLSYKSWYSLSIRSGFVRTQLLSQYPSRFLGEIYAALSFTKGVSDGSSTAENG